MYVTSDHALPVLQDSLPAIDEETLSIFEREIDASLPVAYRNFLLSQNGGSYRQGTICFDQRNQPIPASHGIVSLYGLLKERDPILDYLDIRWTISVTAGFLPNDTMPIGANSLGDQICLYITGRNRGRIYIVNHEEDLARKNAVQLIAFDFGDFLSSIRYWVEPIETSPLFRAIELGETSNVHLLLSNGKSISRDDLGETPLLAAVSHCQPDIVRFLLDSGASLDERDFEGRNSVWKAANRGALDILRLLLDRGADINVADNDGVTPLITCASQGDVRSALFLIDRGARIDARSNYGDTPASVCTSHDAKMYLLPRLVSH